MEILHMIAVADAAGDDENRSLDYKRAGRHWCTGDEGRGSDVFMDTNDDSYTMEMLIMTIILMVWVDCFTHISTYFQMSKNPNGTVRYLDFLDAFCPGEGGNGAVGRRWVQGHNGGFHITEPVWGESTGQRCIPLTKGPVMRNFRCSHCCWLEKLLNKQSNCHLRCHDAHVA